MTTSSSPGPRSKGVQYAVGDRVMHKPTLQMALNSPLPDRKKYGTVIEVIYKTNKRGAKMPYVRVQWDDSQRPELHMTMRIKRVDD